MYCPPPKKHSITADERSYYVSGCVSRHIQSSPLGCDSVKPVILYTESILVHRVSYETRKCIV